MTKAELTANIFGSGSYLCTGLDTDVSLLPAHLKNKKNAVVEFNRAIIDATLAHCVAYKINTAFYEARGAKGWDEMAETLEIIPSTHLKIADAKRADIGNTSAQYAKAFFETLRFDAVTVAPYMGEDSLRPFLDYENKWTIVLGLTSNKGAADFEMLRLISESETGLRPEFLYEHVLRSVAKWSTPNNCMFVVGATQAVEFENLRRIVPDHFLLVPGVGAQGGSLEAVSRYGLNADAGLLVNASRALLYAGSGENFAEVAGKVAAEYHSEMKTYLPSN